MNIKHTLMKLIVSSVFILGSIAANATVQYVSTSFAQKNNSNGTSTVVLGVNLNGFFCALNGVGHEDTDSGGEIARCRVRVVNSAWILEAILQGSDDADVYCYADCFNSN